MSLLSNEAVSAVLSLAETGDLDALVDAEYAVLRELKTLLRDVGLIYDELSPEIWIPPGASFETLFEFSNIVVKRIDPESALVSKAVKAREKNRLLVQEAVASEKFPNLLARIEKHGGDLAYFLEE
ncbi:MAG: hypothetical protein JST04_08250 [Bdellovibrionales bacterium]|nr:hypothetical protein [Bdellovibrionales bacterium]